MKSAIEIARDGIYVTKVSRTDGMRVIKSFERVNGIAFDPFNSLHISTIHGKANHEAFFRTIKNLQREKMSDDRVAEKMNYDPNMNYCGRRTKQAVRLTFGKWQYRKTIEVEVGGNCTGLAVIDAAVCIAFEKCWPDPDELPTLTMEDKDGNTLSCDDDEDEGEEWLKKMLLSAEIISIRPEA